MSFLTASAAVFLAISAAAATVGLTPTNLAARPATPDTATEDTAIRPFRVNVPEEQLVDLRRRLVATQSPDQETVGDCSQGIQLAKLQEFVDYWEKGYDWCKADADLLLTCVLSTVGQSGKQESRDI